VYLYRSAKQATGSVCEGILRLFTMGQTHSSSPVLLLVAVCSRHAPAFCWAYERMARYFGEVLLESDTFSFTETDYYTQSMGTDLRKQFLAFAALVDPETLPAIKVQTNLWETQYAEQSEHAEPRPLNLDPGYITRAKLVLASTKDHAHRIYLQNGIYAEVTLSFRKGAWRSFDWTYPDYRRSDFQHFFTRCRERLSHLL
jgi:hypothetical protein